MNQDTIHVELRNPVCGLIADELEARGITQTEAAKSMNINKQALNALVNYRRELSTDMALRIERYLGISAEFLLKLQTAYSLKQAKAEKEELIHKEVEPLVA